MMPQLPGVLTDPLVGLVLVAVAVNALSAYLAYRVTRSIGSAVAERARTTDPEQSRRAADGEVTVECRKCGTENEPGYRYCRECIAELPGSVAFERSGSGAPGRLVE
jgi:ribosomal protein L40E